MPMEPTTIPTPAPAGQQAARAEAGRLPVVTLTIAAVNLLFWLATVATAGVPSPLELFAGSHNLAVLIAFGAKVNALVQRGEYWRLVSPMFLHANLLHLVINSYNLLLLGGFIEHLYGRKRFLILYVMSGFCGNLASYLFGPDMMVGAATGLFGLFGATAVFWSKHRRWLAPEFRQRMGNQLFWLLLVNLTLSMLFPVVDVWGFLGGLLGGVALAAMAESRLSGEMGRDREWLPVPFALVTALSLLAYAGVGVARNLSAERPLLAAELAASRGQYPRAVEALRRAVARHPEIRELRLQLARTLIRAERWTEALAVLQDLRKERPGDPYLQQMVLNAAVGGRKWDQAIPILENRLRSDPENTELITALASVLSEARRNEDAARYYRQALRLRPDDPMLLNNLAYLYADQLRTNLPEALQMARRATSLEPRSGTYWDTLAWVYYRLGQLDEALAAQREAVIMTPRQAEVRFHMGAIHEARGDLAAARDEYRRALESDPGFAPAIAALRRLGSPLSSPRPPSSAPPAPGSAA